MSIPIAHSLAPAVLLRCLRSSVGAGGVIPGHELMIP